MPIVSLPYRYLPRIPAALSRMVRRCYRRPTPSLIGGLFDCFAKKHHTVGRSSLERAWGSRSEVQFLGIFLP